MCERCFTKEYDKFSTFQEFEDFKYELESKLLNGGDLFLLDTNTYIKQYVLVNIYKCNKCETKWFLNIPKEKGFGFFVDENNLSKKLKIIRKAENEYIVKYIFLFISILFLMFIAIKVLW